MERERGQSWQGQNPAKQHGPGQYLESQPCLCLTNLLSEGLAVSIGPRVASVRVCGCQGSQKKYLTPALASDPMGQAPFCSRSLQNVWASLDLLPKF